MKILFYNWVDYLDDEDRGGGVSVYQRNVMASLGEIDGVQVHFLSSGLSRDLLSRAPRWEQVRHGPSDHRDRRFEIVNSGVLSPSHHSFGDPAQIDHAETAAVFGDFLMRNGPYDVVHFNNLEGVPATVLALKERFPQTLFILSLHNYYPFCPQVNLWRQERQTCADYNEGRHCVTCLTGVHDGRMLRLWNGVAYHLKRAGLRPGGVAFRAVFWVLRRGAGALRRAKARAHRPKGQLQPLRPADGAPFAARRARMVDLINRHCDHVLCVSDAVRVLAERYGLRRELCQTSYIGTREAAAFSTTVPHPLPKSDDGILTLGYLGYMRQDKGFFFLLQALESLPAALAVRVRLVLAARRGDRATMDRVRDLSAHLAEVDYANGYGHDDLDRLLAPVDVGVLPVLWHDNLPQVAIEMHARHIPLLTSDLGGAQELGNCSDMVFPAGDVAAFQGRIAALLSGEIDMDAYWRSAVPPVGMAQHINELMALYAGSSRARTKGLSAQGTDSSGS